MSKQMNSRKPASPAPPVNAKRNPAASGFGNKTKSDHASLSAPKQTTKFSGDEDIKIYKPSGKPVSQKAKKAKKSRASAKAAKNAIPKAAKKASKNTPEKSAKKSAKKAAKNASKNTLLKALKTIPKKGHGKVKQTDIDNYDVPAAVKVYNERKKGTGLWVTVIVALSILCLAAGVFYLYVNGYFDGLIKML